MLAYAAIEKLFHFPYQMCQIYGKMTDLHHFGGYPIDSPWEG